MADRGRDNYISYQLGQIFGSDEDEKPTRDSEQESTPISSTQASTIELIQNDIERLKDGSISAENFAQELRNRAAAYPAESPAHLLFIIAADEFLEEVPANATGQDLVAAYIDGLSRAGRSAPTSGLRDDVPRSVFRDASRIDSETGTASIGDVDEQRIAYFAHTVDVENTNNTEVDHSRLGYAARADITDRQRHDHNVEQTEAQINADEKAILDGRIYEGVSNDFSTDARQRVQTAIDRFSTADQHDLVSGSAGERDAEIRDPNDRSRIITLGEHVDNVTAQIMKDLGMEQNTSFQEFLAAEILKETDGRILHGESRLRASEIEDALETALDKFNAEHDTAFTDVAHLSAYITQNNSGGSTDLNDITERRIELRQQQDNPPPLTPQEIEANRAAELAEQQALRDAQIAELTQRRDQFMEDIIDERKYGGISDDFVIGAQSKIETAMNENIFEYDMVSGSAGNRDSEIRDPNDRTRIITLGEHVDNVTAKIMQDLGIDNPELQELLAAEILKETDGRAFHGEARLRASEIEDALDEAVDEYNDRHGTKYKGIEQFVAKHDQDAANGPTDMDSVNAIQAEIDALQNPPEPEPTGAPDEGAQRNSPPPSPIMTA